MEYLLNHADICALIYSGQHQRALDSFHQNYTVHLTKVCIAHCKLYLSSLNQSLYNYILIHEKVSLHRCCLENHQKINFCGSLSQVYELGKSILSSYSFCTEYLIEKHENPTIKKALMFIHEHLTMNLSLEQIANFINISPTYLCTLFKTQTGYTIKDYIHFRRSVLAKKLLQETSLPLEEIATRCGYNSYSYFSRQFKLHMKVTPTAFRRQIIS